MAKQNKRAAGIASVRRRLVPLSKADPYAKVLVYGRNGTGKTRFGGSGPRPFVLDCNDHGTKSISERPGEAFFANNWSDVVFAYWFLKQGDHDFETCVLDNLTMMQNLCISHVLKQNERDGLANPKTMSQREWGILKEYMGPQILDFRNLPMHVVMIAQERTIENEDEERTERVPDMSPGVRGFATGSVDIIGRMQNRPFRRGSGSKEERIEWHSVMFTGESEEYLSKDRKRYVERGFMVDPTVPRVVEAMKAKTHEPTTSTKSKKKGKK